MKGRRGKKRSKSGAKRWRSPNSAKKRARHSVVINPELNHGEDAFSRLYGLTDGGVSLFLDTGGLHQLHPDIGKLTELKWIDARGNKLLTLPPSIAQLTNLLVLDADSNNIESLPDLSGLDNFKLLSLRNNNLRVFPPGERLPPNLSELHLSGNTIRALPQNATSAYKSLSKLTALSLDVNRIQKLPAGFCQGLGSLRHLVLSQNMLTELPPEVGELVQLSSLDVCENRLIRLPDSICRLSHLSSLRARNNCLEGLPETIGEMKKLHTADFAFNCLTSIPKSIGDLVNIAELTLNFNCITSIPEEIANIESMCRLDLSNNDLETIPASLGDMKGLRKLDISGNLRINVLPNEIGMLAMGRSVMHPRVVKIDKLPLSRLSEKTREVVENKPNDFDIDDKFLLALMKRACTVSRALDTEAPQLHVQFFHILEYLGLDLWEKKPRASASSNLVRFPR